MNVLLALDDKGARRRLVSLLRSAGYSVVACSVRAGERRLAAVAYDLVLIDWNGLKLCRQTRCSGLTTPLLMLTSRTGIADKLLAFEEGVDDYVTIPFHDEELLARVAALLRRYDILGAGPLLLNLRERTAFWAGQRLDLTARELLLLSLLVRNAGRVLTREQLFRAISRSGQSPNSNLIDVHIRNLRLKLGPGASQLWSVWGSGYCYHWTPAPPGSEHLRPAQAAAGRQPSRQPRGRTAPRSGPARARYGLVSLRSSPPASARARDVSRAAQG